MCRELTCVVDDDMTRIASELAETLEGMSLYARKLAATPDCPRNMASELQLMRVALSVCIARADALSNALDAAPRSVS